jgi:hypothetical protein
MHTGTSGISQEELDEMNRNQKKIADLLVAKASELQTAERKLDEVQRLRDRELAEMKDYYESLLRKSAATAQPSE